MAAFQFCSALETINIPDGVRVINEQTFWGCDDLKSIVIGSGVVFIDEDAFYRTESLTDVYYCGSSRDWESITILNGIIGGSPF